MAIPPVDDNSVSTFSSALTVKSVVSAVQFMFLDFSCWWIPVAVCGTMCQDKQQLFDTWVRLTAQLLTWSLSSLTACAYLNWFLMVNLILFHCTYLSRINSLGHMILSLKVDRPGPLTFLQHEVPSRSPEFYLPCDNPSSCCTYLSRGNCQKLVQRSTFTSAYWRWWTHLENGGRGVWTETQGRQFCNKPISSSLRSAYLRSSSTWQRLMKSSGSLRRRGRLTAFPLQQHVSRDLVHSTLIYLNC